MKNQDTQTASKKDEGNGVIPLGKQNYYLILLGIVVLIIGFILMSGGKYTDPAVFNAEELYSTRRITVAPIVVILGFAIEIFAIFYRPNKAS